MRRKKTKQLQFWRKIGCWPWMNWMNRILSTMQQLSNLTEKMWWRGNVSCGKMLLCTYFHISIFRNVVVLKSKKNVSITWKLIHEIHQKDTHRNFKEVIISHSISVILWPVYSPADVVEYVVWSEKERLWASLLFQFG